MGRRQGGWKGTGCALTRGLPRESGLYGAWLSTLPGTCIAQQGCGFRSLLLLPWRKASVCSSQRPTRDLCVRTEPLTAAGGPVGPGLLSGWAPGPAAALRASICTPSSLPWTALGPPLPLNLPSARVSFLALQSSVGKGCEDAGLMAGRVRRAAETRALEPRVLPFCWPRGARRCAAEWFLLMTWRQCSMVSHRRCAMAGAEPASGSRWDWVA